MPRHPLDKERARDDGHRAKEYARIERETADESQSPAVQAIHKARPAAKGPARSREFQKIERKR